jgi:hypothetical protein
MLHGYDHWVLVKATAKLVLIQYRVCQTHAPQPISHAKDLSFQDWIMAHVQQIFAPLQQQLSATHTCISVAKTGCVVLLGYAT